MKVKVEKDLCISCGACQAICSEVFEIDEISKVIVDTVPDDLKESVIEAIESCPTDAIKEIKEN